MATHSVFLPGESQEQGSLVGCRLWGRTESDTTEVTLEQQQQQWNLELDDISFWSYSLKHDKYESSFLSRRSGFLHIFHT